MDMPDTAIMVMDKCICHSKAEDGSESVCFNLKLIVNIIKVRV